MVKQMISFVNFQRNFELKEKVDPIQFSVDKVTIINYYTMLFQYMLYSFTL